LVVRSPHLWLACKCLPVCRLQQGCCGWAGLGPTQALEMLTTKQLFF